MGILSASARNSGSFCSPRQNQMGSKFDARLNQRLFPSESAFRSPKPRNEFHGKVCTFYTYNYGVERWTTAMNAASNFVPTHYIHLRGPSSAISLKGWYNSSLKIPHGPGQMGISRSKRKQKGTSARKPALRAKWKVDSKIQHVGGYAASGSKSERPFRARNQRYGEMFARRRSGARRSFSRRPEK